MAGGIGMAVVIVSVFSINILPYILVAVKSSFFNFDVSNIYKTIFTSLANELPPYLLYKRGYVLAALVYLSVCLFVCLWTLLKAF